MEAIEYKKSLMIVTQRVIIMSVWIVSIVGEFSMVECPTVFCEKDVPVWYCLGSFTQRREPCPEMIELVLSFDKPSIVKCKKQAKTR